MKVHIVLAIHDNGTSIYGVYSDLAEAERIAEELEAGAEEQHNIVEFHVETFPVDV